MYQLCDLFWPHVCLMLDSHELWNWCLVVSKVFVEVKVPLNQHVRENFGCLLKAWACSMWYVPYPEVCTIGALGIAFQYHLYLRKNDSSISWYPSLLHLLWAYQGVPIGSPSGYFCQSVLMLRRPHYLASVSRVETLFLLGNCTIYVCYFFATGPQDGDVPNLDRNPSVPRLCH